MVLQSWKNLLNIEIFNDPEIDFQNDEVNCPPLDHFGYLKHLNPNLEISTQTQKRGGTGRGL